MFNPTNLDEVCVQATHMESKGKNTKEKIPRNILNKGKGKHTTMVNKKGENPTCIHCHKKGCDASKCWKLHPELKPRSFRIRKTRRPLLQQSNMIWDLTLGVKLILLLQAFK